MQKIGIVVGETSSLPKEIIEKEGFLFVPYVVNWEEKERIPGENIFQKMRNAEKLKIQSWPKTSQPSPFVFKKVFEEGLKKFEKLICITLSSKLSGGFNSALQAREFLPEKERIFVLDSMNVTIGEGLIVLKVNELIREGKGIEEILKEFEKIRGETHLFGMVEHPKWLEAGGRISHTMAMVLEKMQNLGMRPLIGVKEGVVKPVALKMKAKDLVEALFKELEKETKKEEKERIKVAIGHGENLEAAQRLKTLIEEKLKLQIAFLNLVDPVIGVHVGPGSLAVAWLKF